MNAPRHWFPALALAGCSIAAPAEAGLVATTGLPQVADLAGTPRAWRYLTLRAASADFELEARLPVCLDPGAATPVSSRGAAGADCGPLAGGESGGPSRQLGLRWSPPELLPGGPAPELMLRHWGRHESHRRGDTTRGTEFSAGLRQAFGPWRLYLGRVEPIDAGGTGADWPARIVSLAWKPAPGRTLEFVRDEAREARWGDRDLLYAIRYSHAAGPQLRWRLYLNHYVDSVRRPWQGGLGLDWRF